MGSTGRRMVSLEHSRQAMTGGKKVVETVTLTVPESQVVEWVRQLSPKAKRDVLKMLVPELDELDVLVEYGSQRMRQLCAERGIDWDSLTEDERQRRIDELLHGAWSWLIGRSRISLTIRTHWTDQKMTCSSRARCALTGTSTLRTRTWTTDRPWTSSGTQGNGPSCPKNRWPCSLSYRGTC